MKILGNIVNTLKNNSGRIITGAAGLAGLGYVGYDAHYIGKLQSDLYASEHDANSTAYYLNNDMYSTNMSKIQEKIKDKSYEMELDQGWKRFFNTGIGYIKGFTSMLVAHVVPLGLSLGALFAPGKASKICAGGLGVYAIYEFFKNFFGFGTPGGLLK
ncbi:hypothetical protein IJ541_07555 [bacterium]|nr:hypothetical protein [bacterium]